MSSDTAERFCTALLRQANDAITRERAVLYGDAEESFASIAGAWNWWLEGRLTSRLTPHDVAMMMGLLKDARARGNPRQRDNYIDGLGYRALAGELAINRSQKPSECALCT
jgi:hypothetical protein